MHRWRPPLRGSVLLLALLLTAASFLLPLLLASASNKLPVFSRRAIRPTQGLRHHAPGPEPPATGQVTAAHPIASAVAAAATATAAAAPQLSPRTAWQYQVGVLAIFRGEAPYLPEWLEYHRLIGVQHFWLLTNDCEQAALDAAVAALHPYVAAGLVTLDLRYRCAVQFQRDAYNVLLSELRASGAVQWLGVFDIDEFAAPAAHNASLAQLLDLYAQPDKRIAAVALNRLMFGTSGHVTKPMGSVLASYVLHAHPFMRGGSANEVLQQVKMFVLVEHCLHLQIHGCDVVTPSYVVVNTREEPFNYYEDGKLAYPRVASLDVLWLAHYYTRSEQEYSAKNSRGDAQYPTRPVPALPTGTDDVVNFHLVDAVQHRIGARDDSGITSHGRGSPSAPKATARAVVARDVTATAPPILARPPPEKDDSAHTDVALLQQLLLAGAPSAGARAVLSRGKEVWSDALVAEGTAMQRSGEWPLDMPMYAPVRSKLQTPHYNVCLAAVFKAESVYLEEWLEYHKLLGVQQVYLIANDCPQPRLSAAGAAADAGNVHLPVDSAAVGGYRAGRNPPASPSTPASTATTVIPVTQPPDPAHTHEYSAAERVLRPFVAQGFVQVDQRFQCAQALQTDGYNSVLGRVRAEESCEWLGFFDIDEFLHLEDTTSSVFDFLRQFKSEIAGVALNRLVFGPGQHVTQPTGSVIALYMSHADPFASSEPTLHQVRMFVRPSKCTHVQVHGCDEYQPYWGGTVNTQQAFFQYHWANGQLRYPRGDSFVGAWLHHYYSKSTQEFAGKARRGSAQTGLPTNESFPEHLFVKPVLNRDVIHSVRDRIQRLDPASAVTLSRVLLAGAPSLEQEQALIHAAAVDGTPVWSPEFVREGVRRQASREAAPLPLD